MKKISLLFICAILTAIAMGQVYFVNSTNVMIGNGSFVKAGDIKILGTGAFHVNGELRASGNITNDAANAFLPSDGKVVLDGAQQYISGSNPVYFPILELNGTGKKIMQQDIFAGNTITFTDHILLLNNQTLQLNSKLLTILSSSANAIQRSGNGFIESETNSQNGYSWLQWNIKNNTGNYIFPFGNSITNTYLPLSATLHQAGTGSNGFIRAAIYPTDMTQSPNNRPFPIAVTNMNNTAGQEAASKTADRFWIVEAGNYSNKPVADLKLSYLESEWDNSNGSANNISENLLTPHAWDGIRWVLATGSIQANNNTLTIISNNFSNNTWRATQGTGALPVTLFSFTAQLNNIGNADIKWSTATEINTDRFEIEKSTNANQFTHLKTVTAAGNSSTTRNYYEQDNQVATGITFYRLKMIDLDGSFKYSNIASVKKLQADEALIYPNPATDNISVVWSKPITQNVTCNIYDASGKRAMQWVVQAGNTQTTKDIRILSAGTYALSWIVDGKNNSRLFVKK